MQSSVFSVYMIPVLFHVEVSGAFYISIIKYYLMAYINRMLNKRYGAQTKPGQSVSLAPHRSDSDHCRPGNTLIVAVFKALRPSNPDKTNDLISLKGL